MYLRRKLLWGAYFNEPAGPDDNHEGNPTQGGGNTSGNPASVQETTPDPRIKKLSDEAAGYRTQLRATEKERDQFKAQAEKFQKDFSVENVKAALILAAARAKFNDPEDVVRMIALDNLLAESDAAKRATAIGEAVKTLLESKPYLATQVSPNSPAGNLATQTSVANPATTPRLTIEQIRRMSPLEILARKAEVDRVLAEQT